MRTKILFLFCLVAMTATAQTKSIAVLGDSYSTYEGYITPSTNEPWYFLNPNIASTDVIDVRQTWWHLLCAEHGYKLEINNSYSGATISYTGYNGEDYSPRSFITRADNLGCPDIILVFGGTNDSWAGSPLGEMKYEGITRDDLYSYRPAVCYLANYLSARYPNTDIYFLLNTDLKPEIGEAMHSACARYGISVIDLHDISKMDGHPDIAGMKAIADQVAAALSAK
ncbi:MAG: SGNH/GDSL hydrolase family protein [Prevotella sp.]|nr:SGNH/GDSL hydrolase family protein [Prevotella sp.]